MFPVAIGWAIVKDDLFEVDAIIRRAVAWAILTGVIAALYLAGVGLLEVWFAGRASRVAQLFFLLALVAVLNPLHNQVQVAIDYLFARGKYDYRKIVDEASQALATLLDLETRRGAHPHHDHRDDPRRVRRRVAARRGRQLPAAGGGRPRRARRCRASSTATAR